jgi:hypothetical protein
MQYFLGQMQLLVDFKLNKFRQIPQRLLPSQITSFNWNGIWHAFLHDA